MGAAGVWICPNRWSAVVFQCRIEACRKPCGIGQTKEFLRALRFLGIDILAGTQHCFGAREAGFHQLDALGWILPVILQHHGDLAIGVIGVDADGLALEVCNALDRRILLHGSVQREWPRCLGHVLGTG